MTRYQNSKRNAEIVRRRDAGEWPREITLSMGISRNIVAGVLKRAGKCDPEISRSGGSGADGRRSKLSPEAVSEIRAAYVPRDAEFGATALALKHQVRRTSIYAVIARRNWKHVQ